MIIDRQKAIRGTVSLAYYGAPGNGLLDGAARRGAAAGNDKVEDTL